MTDSNRNIALVVLVVLIGAGVYFYAQRQQEQDTPGQRIENAAEELSDGIDDAAHEAKDAVVGDSISALPATGAVTVSGTVTYIDTIDNEFTLQDKTGQIDVESNQKLTVAKGDKVTVSGSITEDMGEKEIAASKITVSNSQAN